MNPLDILLIAVIAAIFFSSLWYIRSSKKKGIRCIGCPDAPRCSGNCSGCPGKCGSCSSQ